MRYLLDTGILLRMVNQEASAHAAVRRAVARVKANGHETVTAFQNRVEFWAVSTRPASARGGVGLEPAEARRRLGVIERVTMLLPDAPGTYERWRELVDRHQVRGVQVHEARLAALMGQHGVTHLLTLNKQDFLRFPHVVAVSPEEVLAEQSQPRT